MDNYFLTHTGAELDEAIRKVLSGELNVPLQEKTVTPTTDKQIVTPDSNYKGLSSVVVTAIPQNYLDESYNAGYSDGYADGQKTMYIAAYTVSDIYGVSYGFSVNSSGYYESTNKGVNSSAALCRVNFDLPIDTTVYFDCINYAESNYDYGIIGLVDTALGTTYTADSLYTHSFKGSSNSEVQAVSMDIPSGTHYVDIKFRKDTSTHSNNDSLQFKVRFV